MAKCYGEQYYPVLCKYSVEERESVAYECKQTIISTGIPGLRDS